MQAHFPCPFACLGWMHFPCLLRPASAMRWAHMWPEGSWASGQSRDWGTGRGGLSPCGPLVLSFVSLLTLSKRCFLSSKIALNL